MSEKPIGVNKNGIRVFRSYNKPAAPQVHWGPHAPNLGFDAKRIAERGCQLLESEAYAEAHMYFVRALILNKHSHDAKIGMEYVSDAVSSRGGNILEYSPQMMKDQYHWLKSLFRTEWVKCDRDAAIVEFARNCIKTDRVAEAEQKLKEHESKKQVFSADVYFLLGRVRYLRGDKFHAAKYYEKALMQDPDHAEAKEALDLLG